MNLKLRAALAGLCLLLMGVANAQDGGSSRVTVDIERQPIRAALERFAEQTGLQVVVRDETVPSTNIITSRVTGTLTVDAALKQLLAGTDLKYEFVNTKTIRISSANHAGAGSSPSSGSTPAADAAGKPAAEAPADPVQPPETLQEILVRGQHLEMSTMKGDAPILEIPQNIQVLSGALLQDMGAVLLEDGLRNVAGVMPGGYVNGWDYYRIRGFESDATYLDGLRLDNFTGLNVELSTIERLEVIKGPASTLYGDLFSGMVNLVSKRPKPEAFLDVSLSTGSYGFQEATLDFGGSFNSDHTVYGRMISVYRHDDTRVSLSKGITRYYFAPSLTWEIDPATKLTLLGTANRDINDLAGTLPAAGTVLPNVNGKIPLDIYTGDAVNPQARVDESLTLGYQFTHQFNSALSFRQNARGAWRTCDNKHPKISSWYLGDDQRTLYRYAFQAHCDWDIYSVDSGFDLNFAAAAMDHHMTFGVDFTHTLYESRTSYSDMSDPTTIPPLDLFNPVYTSIPSVTMYPTDPYDASTRSIGLYVNDRIKFSWPLTLTLGGRFDNSKGGDNYSPYESGSAFVKNLGVSYELAPGLVAYANYSEAFSPQYYVRLAGNRFPDPLRGKSEEVGIKTALFDDRLNTTLAFFNLKRENVATSDPTNPGFYLLSGDERSRGVEFDSQILLAPGWEMLMSMTYLDGKVTASDDVPVGSPLINVPKASGSLWTRYTVRGGVLQGLSFSFGGSTYSSQSGDAAHTFDLPKYTLVNANVAYRRNNFRIQLNVDNLFNETYYSGSYDINYVLPGKPRTVRATLGWSL